MSWLRVVEWGYSVRWNQLLEAPRHVVERDILIWFTNWRRHIIAWYSQLEGQHARTTANSRTGWVWLEMIQLMGCETTCQVFIHPHTVANSNLLWP